eukprot:TRINITY_DN17841_c0_g1_i1.p1 TRINITY_DN17841_c0_g1~~TRINITY_DN17841_c0_g1_i1.p1  ORF type:complete len:102 (-),score=14.02 TRINITY_DN17841_c0_g1_i1:167-472(-)
MGQNNSVIYGRPRSKSRVEFADFDFRVFRARYDIEVGEEMTIDTEVLIAASNFKDQENGEKFLNELLKLLQEEGDRVDTDEDLSIIISMPFIVTLCVIILI